MDCDSCRHASSRFVKVGDAAYGNDVEDWSCAMEDRMNDEDVELNNQGRCPFWSPDVEQIKEYLVKFDIQMSHLAVQTLGYDFDWDAHAAPAEHQIRRLASMFGIDYVEDISPEAHNRIKIKKVGDMLRDPEYHDIIVEMVHEFEEGW